MELIGRLKNLSVWLWEKLFPKECVGCSAEGSYFCNDCFGKVELKKDSVCFLCNRGFARLGICNDCAKSSGLDAVIVATSYKDTLIERLIKYLKYNFVIELADSLAMLLARQIDRHGAKELLKGAIVIPVPLHRRRFLERGFNQSELLAKKLADLYNLELKSDVVSRVKKTKPQFGLPREERQKNICGAFNIVKPELVNGRTVAIVDDLLTTGATMEELATALKAVGAGRVIGLVVAHE
jgi:ComF family protein